LTQLLHKKPPVPPDAPVEKIDNTERLVRLAYFVAIVLVLALVTGFSPFLGVIFALIAIVMLHELGHFATAKWSGMKVSEYFFGFGPRLWSIKKGETEYGIKAIPAGGYVRILGMNNLEKVDPADEPRTYRQQSYPKRLLVAVAGSAMHFLLAFLLLVVVWAAIGLPKPTLAIGEISKVKDGESPAQIAGFQVGDRVLAVNGRIMKKWSELPPYIQKKPGQSIEFIVQRGDHLLKLTAVPQSLPSETHKGKTMGFVGISPKTVNERVGVPAAFWHAGGDMVRYTKATVGALGSVFAPSSLREYTSQLSGSGEVTGKDAERPVSAIGFVRVAGQAVQHGWIDFVILLVAINIFIGIFNLVPLLPLDGGHVAIATYERIRSRKGRQYHADVAKLLPLTAAVVAVLVIFGAMTMYLDIVRPIANPFQ